MEENETTVEVKNEAVKTKKPKKTFDERLELMIVILLGVTAVFTAWASWIGSLHGGNQSTNYTTSNNMAADGNARWNEASQSLMQDMMTWNSINDYRIEITYAQNNGDETNVEKLQWKVEELINNNCSESFAEAINWAIDQEEESTPFEMDGYLDSYYADANACLAESEKILEQGKQDNANGDAFGLVTVIYSVVLFLLGIVGTFKRMPNKVALVIISFVAFILATIYMFTIPLPTGFDLLGFLK